MIGRKKSTATEQALADTLAKREKAEHDAEQARATLVTVEAETERRLQEVALSSATPQAFTEAKQQAIAELGTAEANEERTRRAFDALSAQADALAVQAATERVETLTAAVAAKAAERDGIADKLATVTAEHDALADDLANAELQVPRAARWTDGNRERAEVLDRQEAETVEWMAQHRPTRPHEWPSHLRDKIAAAVDCRKGEAAEARIRLAEQSAENLRAHGIDPAEVPGLRPGQAFPRLKG